MSDSIKKYEEMMQDELLYYKYIGNNYASFTYGEIYCENSKGNNESSMNTVKGWIKKNCENNYKLMKDYNPNKETKPTDENAPRVFGSGASRNSDIGKNDYDGFLSPYVIKSFGDYMHKMRYLEDGSMRDSDNWQKGIPLDQYRKSMWRHFMDVWVVSRTGKDYDDNIIFQDEYTNSLNALLFNVMGLLHEELKTPKKPSKRVLPF